MFERMPRSEIYKITGDPVGNCFSNAKLVWLKLNEPENFAKTAMFTTHQDYFLKEFGADGYYTDASSASREGMMDVDNGVWSKEIHDLCGVPIEKRAKLVLEPGKVVGYITKEVSEASGLAVGTPICLGAHDQNCNTFGSGGVKDGTAVMVVGTFGSCFVVSDKSIRDPNGKLVVKGNHGCGNFTIEAFSSTAASSYRWYRDTFCDFEKFKAPQDGVDPYELINAQIEKSPIGARGITFLPYLQGVSGAKLNASARATFIGMSLGTTKADMARSVMEGICYEMYDILVAEKAAGVSPKSIRLTGGAAKSPLWCQMMADVVKLPIHILEQGETGCLGAALYAGVGVGLYKDCEEASKVARIKKTFDPNPANFAAYDEAYAKFNRVYDALNGSIF